MLLGGATVHTHLWLRRTVAVSPMGFPQIGGHLIVGGYGVVLYGDDWWETPHTCSLILKPYGLEPGLY